MKQELVGGLVLCLIGLGLLFVAPVTLLLMFVGATFQITSDHYNLGAICFAAAASFAYSANLYRKKGM